MPSPPEAQEWQSVRRGRRRDEGLAV